MVSRDNPFKTSKKQKKWNSIVCLFCFSIVTIAWTAWCTILTIHSQDTRVFFLPRKVRSLIRKINNIM